ncbi:uncharacterized protein EV420DRAFT_498620 [Desarmillaria tabescens]|uniref:F-box domain-containing protein n=1 Tax=Armillaria tabescens TaxID=1929756 RepID=A0AA39KAN5_ARMTA|nr:uncharacterized protein EV420DRAFT_498620 [Desarmillaria tabescens]KAK0457497.1 hypothetical protein EV420DRAFT_498620 [Desarmillaria tabescens]
MQPLVHGPLTVCKLWADITMDSIWQEIDDPSVIFRLLGPVEERPLHDEDGVYDSECSFKTLPTLSGWARFDIYRRRIRVLDDVILCTSYRPVINDIAVLQPNSMAFLPNLTELSWLHYRDDSWRESVFFMHEGIKRFSLGLELEEPETHEAILKYFEHIATRMPHLQSFTLRLYRDNAIASEAHIGPALSWLLPKLRFLKVLVLPAMEDMYAVIASTASLPNLETIDAPRNVQLYETLFSISPPSFHFTFSCNLQSLSLTISYSDAATRLLCTEFPTMTKLCLRSYKLESSISTRSLTKAISLHCESLRDIELIAVADELDFPTDERITLADIQPLFGCRSVVRFRISHVLPLQLTNNDIITLLRNWGTVIDLSLNDSPSRLLPPESEPYSDWETLVVVAEHGRHLEHLGLHLNGFAEIRSHVSMPPPLPKLKQLSVGTSDLPSKMKDVLGPARFLSRFLTLQCLVHSSYQGLDHTGWNILSELLESFIRVRMEEQELARTRIC